MNNNSQNQNNQSNTIKQQNSSMSALDALNEKLSAEKISPPPSNARQSNAPKNINTTNKLKKKSTKKNPVKKIKIVEISAPKKIKKVLETEENMNLEKLDEEIRKLELELRNRQMEKKEEIQEKEEIQLKQENTETKETKENTDATEIKQSKLALIKLLLDAKNKKETSDNIVKTPVIIEENVNSNYYQENFDIENYEPENIENNNIGEMEIQFNQEEGAKLIKVIEDEDLNYIVPTNVKIRSSNPNNSFAISRNNVSNLVKGSIYFDIDSENITSYDCYNDYMVNLDKKIVLTDINIKNIELPINNLENINTSNNELKININGKEQIFELEENYYNRDEIKDFLNEAFISYNFDINCDIQDGNFIFYSNNKFTMLNHDTSILPILGFNKNAYVNKNMYTAENPHQIGDNIFYLVIENISSEPLFYINKDTNEIKKLFDFEPLQTDNLIIKFNKSPKDLIKNNKEYNFFFETKHTITFELIL